MLHLVILLFYSFRIEVLLAEPLNSERQSPWVGAVISMGISDVGASNVQD